MASKAQFDALAAQINADLDALSPPSGGPQEFVYNLPSGYVVTINDTGIASITRSGVTIANGGTKLLKGDWFYGLVPYNAGFTYPLISKSISGTTNPVVTHNYSVGQAVFTFTVQNDDIQIDTTIKNTSTTTMQVSAVGSPFFKFDNWSARQSNAFNYGQDHTQNSGLILSYPSTNVPFSGSYAIAPVAGQQFAVAIWTRENLSDQWMAIGHGISGGTGIVISGFFFKPIEPGQSRTFKLSYRLSTSTDWHVLLDGYRTDVRAKGLPLKFIPDVRPIASFTSIDVSKIRPDNPYGYNDNNNDPGSQWRRFDKGFQGFVDKLMPGMLQANYQGAILWQPQGINPRGVQYRPDFNVFNPEAESHISELTSGFNSNNKKVGVLCRPSVVIRSSTWITDGLGIQDITSVGLGELNGRFGVMRDRGFQGGYYVDSFPNTFSDQKIIESIRNYLGSAVQLWTEFATVATLPWAGKYGAWTGGAWPPVISLSTQILRWLFPEVPWILKHSSNPPGGFAAFFDWTFPNKFTPMIEDFEVTSTAGILAPYMAQYVDVNNQWIN